MRQYGFKKQSKIFTDLKIMWYVNVELNIQMAEELGDIAGGKLYYDFYKMMLGV